MAVKIVRDVLVASAGVTALVGQRVSPMLKAQDIALPAIVLQRISVTPQNHLQGFGNLDGNRVQLDSWATTYIVARQVADAARTALQAAGYVLGLESDDYDSATQTYRVIQDWSIWK